MTGQVFSKKKDPEKKAKTSGQAAQENQTAKYELPKGLRTRDDIKKEASEYINTPSHPTPSDPPPERFPFKNKHIPASLTNLDGWKNTHTDQELLAEVEARLEKEPHTYLLFEDRLSDEIMEYIEATESMPPDPEPVVEKETANEPQPENATEEKVAEVQKAQKTLMKPSTGLHRSLSNIIAEEQKGIEKSKLNSLFTDRKKR